MLKNQKVTFMGSNQKTIINHIQQLNGEIISTWLNYWYKYSYLNTWQFWIILALFIVPLIALYFLIDRKKALLIGFYGYNVHVWFTYIDTYGGATNLWFYPYKIIPFFTTSFSLDVSLVPVLFMLVYQWTINHNKNYYLYIFLLVVFMAFVFKRVMVDLGLFQLTHSNYFILFLGYFVIALISKLITNIFIWFEKTAKSLS